MTDRLTDLTYALSALTGNHVDARSVSVEIECLIQKMIEEALAAYRSGETMTDRELMQQALDALENRNLADDDSVEGEAMRTLRARLAQPEPKIYNDIDEMFRDMGVPVTEAEPVAWISAEETWLVPKLVISDTPKDGYKPVYTTPPKEWQGLTDEEAAETAYKGFDDYWTEHCEGIDAEAWAAAARAIEAKLKEKNT